MWGDLAFGGDKGEERYQNWVAERRAKGLHNAMSDDEGEEGGDGDGADTVSGRPGDAQVDDNRTAAQLAEDALKAESRQCGPKCVCHVLLPWRPRGFASQNTCTRISAC